jgi:protein TonB
MPFDQRSRKKWTALSITLHVLLLLWFLRPDGSMRTTPNFVLAPSTGGGGEGPAGGGGGGVGGSGAVKYIPLQVPPRPAIVSPIETPPEVKPPVQETPKLPDMELPKVEAPKVSVDLPRPDAIASSPVIGTGGGSGSDGTTGNGPGTGGGVGSGVGTGRGSGVGPGTGGGKGDHYLPSLIEMPIPPLPVPDKVKGFHFEANFYVSATGKVDSVIVKQPTRDGGYNAKLKELFKTFRFRPATTLDGKPIAGVYPYSYVF